LELGDSEGEYEPSLFLVKVPLLVAPSRPYALFVIVYE